MVKIEIPELDIEATIEDGVWTCNEPLFLRELNLLTEFRDQFIKEVYEPYPDHAFAMAVVARFGGKITYCDEQEFDPDVTY